MGASTGKRGPGLVNAAVSLAILVLVASLALTAVQSPPPAIAEIAPSAVEQIKDAPAEQTSDAGLGGGGADGAGSTTTVAPVSGSGPTVPGQTTTTGQRTIERARVRRCVGNPPRQTEDPQSPPCVPYFEGDNGGATYKGVTGDSINLIIPSGDARLVNGLQTYFNKRYEFYGRKLNLIPGGGGETCTERKASAVAADTELKAFGGLDAFSGNSGPCFQTEMARRKLMSVTAVITFGDDELSTYAPYMWQYAMGFDKVLRGAADLYCARLHGAKAIHSPDPTYKQTTRTLGVLVQNVVRDSELDIRAFERGVAACGGKVVATERLSTNDDPGAGAADKANLAIAQFKSKGITTVLNLGEAFASQNISAAADAQQYFPEWIVTSYGAMDQNTVIHAFWPNTSQRQSVFGISAVAPMRPWDQEPAFLAFKEVDPSISPAANIGTVQDFTTQYRALLPIASGIQLAGPNLTPQTMAAALQRTRFPYPKEDPLRSGDVGFRDDRTMTDDFVEMWWSDLARAPSGHQSDGAAGAYCYLDGGARRRTGAWPKGAAPFFQGTCDSNA